MSKYLEMLGEAIRKGHGCECSHVQSVPIKESFQGKTVWDGFVEVFDLTGHPRAKRCYAWATDSNFITTTLEIPPVDGPRKAVQAAIVASLKKPSG